MTHITVQCRRDVYEHVLFRISCARKMLKKKTKNRKKIEGKRTKYYKEAVTLKLGYIKS